jgi:hypothetical protein
MRILLAVVLLVVGIFIVRFMLSSKVGDSQPAKVEPKSKIQQKKRKHRSKHSSSKTPKKPKEEIWVKPDIKKYIPGSPVDQCPNRSNEFHQCSFFCYQRYAERHPSFVQQDQ